MPERAVEPSVKEYVILLTLFPLLPVVSFTELILFPEGMVTFITQFDCQRIPRLLLSAPGVVPDVLLSSTATSPLLTVALLSVKV